MNSVLIRKITSTDIQELHEISVETFIETFASQNSARDMQLYLEQNFNTKKLLSELNNPNSAFYFAILNDQIIGYLKINHGPAQTELKEEKSLEIERIYVLHHFQHRGVGQLLFNISFKIAQESNANYVWLGVWEKNIKAIQFYQKNGFKEFDKHGFILGNDHQTDIMMKLDLNTSKMIENF